MDENFPKTQAPESPETPTPVDTEVSQQPAPPQSMPQQAVPEPIAAQEQAPAAPTFQPTPTYQEPPAGSPGGKSKALMWIILVIFLLILTALGAFYLGSQSAQRQVSVIQEEMLEPTPEPEMETEGLYEDEAGIFSFRYPSEFILSEYDEGVVGLSFLGPTQIEGTEFYDGISLSFKAGGLEEQTIEQVANLKRQELMVTFEVSEPQMAKVGDYDAYSFQVSGYVDVAYYYLSVDGENYLEIVDGTIDPTNAGFAGMVSEIFSSLKMKE